MSNEARVLKPAAFLGPRSASAEVSYLGTIRNRHEGGLGNCFYSPVFTSNVQRPISEGYLLCSFSTSGCNPPANLFVDREKTTNLVSGNVHLNLTAETQTGGGYSQITFLLQITRQPSGKQQLHASDGWKTHFLLQPWLLLASWLAVL